VPHLTRPALRSPAPTSTRQRGVATLTIVAILFFIIALVAAYTNRNLIFEQRTSGNQWRSTLALEAAEGGIEWALSLLNTGRIDANCTTTDDAAQPSFRERYLSFAADGMVTPLADRSFACVSDGSGRWNCSCPTAGAPAPAAPAGTGIYPAFRARFVTLAGARPGVIGLEVNGCTRLDDTCLAFPAQAVGNEGRATLQISLALRSALAAVPVAAITARGGITVGGALGAFNPDPVDGGLVILAGGALSDPGAALRIGSAPGTPGDLASLVIQGDVPLQNLPGPVDRSAAERMFASLFGVWPEVYRDQPGALVIDCDGGCDGDDVRDAAALNPGRLLWLQGDVLLDGADAIGSATAPVALVVDGRAQIDGTVFGLVYVREPADLSAWEASGTGTLTGALVVEGSMAGDAGFAVLRDRAVLETVQRQHGSFVRVPGSWRDF
jgi:hypothetical protein